MLAVNGGIAQIQYSSSYDKSSKIATKTTKSEKDYFPATIHLKALGNPTFNRTQILDEHKIGKGVSGFKSSKNVDKPYVLDGFEAAFDYSSVPNDDAFAVSNQGKIIAARNSRISFYDVDLSFIQVQSLASFASDLGISGAKYDPRVLYDQETDRFIVVFLSGYNAASSQIIIAFSASNDPEGNWHFYAVPGNYLNDNTWSDYPTIAVNNEELFISFTNFADMESFDTWDFYGARIIQMNKNQGYNGSEVVDYAYHLVNPGFAVDTPSTIYYYNVNPVKGGHNLYGPNMYFISTLDCPFPDAETGEFPPNDTVFLVEFSGGLNDPDFEITSELLISDIQYGIKGHTAQPNNHYLSTNYNTVKDAFFAHDFIQFTFNSIDYENETAGIFHGIIEDVGNSNQLNENMISSDTLGLAFASIAYVGENENDKSAVLGFNYSSENLYPGNACLKYDGQAYSEFLVLKEGEGNMDMTDSEIERWGDFTSIQVKYNEPDIIYFSGSFGRQTNTRTWISKLSLTEPQEGIHANNQISSSLNAFPNPAHDYIAFEFETDALQVCRFNLHNAQGARIEVLNKQRLKPGKHRFSFSVSDLKSGVYTVTIKGDKGFIARKKFVVL
jgi:hypothetical protein